VCPRTERSGFPMKILNYLAISRAVVACAGSAKGLVDGATARVVPDDDVTAFAGAVVSLLRDPAERVRLGRAGRRAVESGEAWERVLEGTESMYRQGVGGGPGGGGGGGGPGAGAGRGPRGGGPQRAPPAPSPKRER